MRKRASSTWASPTSCRRRQAPRLVIDIGGGSTEFIIGRGPTPERLESLKLGCVNMSQRFFPGGTLRADAFVAAETHARAEIEAIAREFGREHWHEAYASSGTALALAAILEENGLSAGGITPDGLARLRKRMVGAGHMGRLALDGIKPERAPVLPGGFAIMSAAMAELSVPRINPVGGALRLGVLYDLLGRTGQRDSRQVTVERFLERYHVDRAHAVRVGTMARALYLKAAPEPDSGRRATRGMGRAAARDRLHGLPHRLPQARRVHPRKRRHARLFGAGTAPARGARPRLPRRSVEDGAGAARRRRRSRRCWPCGSPCCSTMRGAESTRRASRLKAGRKVQFGVSARWLARHPLTSHLLAMERAEWAALGVPWRSLR